MHPLRSSAVIDWLDAFTKNEYQNLFLESLEYCQKNKSLEIHAWCITIMFRHFRTIETPVILNLHTLRDSTLFLII